MNIERLHSSSSSLLAAIIVFSWYIFSSLTFWISLSRSLQMSVKWGLDHKRIVKNGYFCVDHFENCRLPHFVCFIPTSKHEIIYFVRRFFWGFWHPITFDYLTVTFNVKIQMLQTIQTLFNFLSSRSIAHSGIWDTSFWKYLPHQNTIAPNIA